jgi:reversibly glycosylated polypeptide
MSTLKKAKVVVAWVTEQERDTFLERWGVKTVQPWLVLQRDVQHEGCGATKNRGVANAAALGAEVVVVLDGDCYPTPETPSLIELVDAHLKALEPQPVELYQQVTAPASRGTPYCTLSMTLPIAASMGFWHGVPDYCAVRQLALGGEEMIFTKEPVYARYFPLCGMNVAFKPHEWWPWCQFVEVSRWDDIWMGWLWQKEAYHRGYAFNLNGPMIYHARQSNVWKNLVDEAKYLKESETLWSEIAAHPSRDYNTLLRLLPAGTANLSRSIHEAVCSAGL